MAYSTDKKKKGKKAKGSGGQARARVVAQFWSDRIKAAKEAKESYDIRAQKVLEYFRDSSVLFEDGEIASRFMEFGHGSVMVSVPKVAQMRAALGPRLYLPRPVRNVEARTDDGVMVGLARVMESYINYSAVETKLARELRKSIDDALLRGRGFLETGWDDVRKCVASWYISSDDVLIDPDVTGMEHAEWIAIRNRESYWRTKRRVNEKWRIKDLDKRAKQEESVGDTEFLSKESPEESDAAPSNYILESWVILSKMGYGFRGADAGEGATRYDDKDDFCRIEVVVDHEFPLAEGPWPVPLHLDREWPLTKVDFVESVDELWPNSVFGQVLPAQKAVDLLTSLRITSCKNRDRMVVFCDAKVEREVQDMLRKGSAADFISIDVRKGGRLQDSVQVANFGQGSPETAGERQFLIDQMETTTGVTPYLTGASQQGSQDRSATATRARTDASTTRVTDLQNRVEEIATDAARKEAVTIRLELMPDEVAYYVRVSDISLFYVGIYLPGAGEIPVRDPRTKEEKEADSKAEKEPPLTLEYIFPPASDYFEEREEALQAAAGLWQTIVTRSSTDIRIQRLLQIIQDQGIDETGKPQALSVSPVTVERVWADTQSLSAEELMRETTYTVATGAGNKFDKAAEQENANNLAQTALPAMLQMGDIQGANAILEIRDDAYDIPEDKRIRIQGPPAPPPQQQQQPQGGQSQ